MISITLTTCDLWLILATVAFSVWRLCLTAEDIARNTDTARFIFERIPSRDIISAERTRLNSPTTANVSSSINATRETNTTRSQSPSTSISHGRTLVDSPRARDVPLILVTGSVNRSTSVLEEPPNDPANLTSGQQVDIGDEEPDQESIGEIPDEDSASDAEEFPVTIDSGERINLSEAHPRLFTSQGAQTVPLPPSERDLPALPSNQISALPVSSHPTPTTNNHATPLHKESLLPASSTSAQNSIPFPTLEPPHIAESQAIDQPPPIPPKNPRRRGTALSRPPFLSRPVKRKRSDAELSPTLAPPPLSNTRPLVVDKGKAREVPLPGDGDTETTESRDSLALKQTSTHELEPMDTNSSSSRSIESLQFLGAGWSAVFYPDDAIPLMHGTMYSASRIHVGITTPELCSVHRIRGNEYKLKTIAWSADSPIPEPKLILDEHSLDATYAIMDQQCQCIRNSAIVRIRDVVQAGSDICVVTDHYHGTLHQLLESLQTLPSDRWATFVSNCVTDIWIGVHEMHSLKIFHRNLASSNILYKFSEMNTYNFYLGDFFDAVHNPGPTKEAQLMKNDYRALLHLISFISWKFSVLHKVEVEKSLVASLKRTLVTLIHMETEVFKATVDSEYLSKLNFLALR